MRGRWNWDRIDVTLHHEKRKQLAATAILNDSNRRDVLGWKPSENNLFTTKSAYELTIPNGGNNKEDWSRIWRLCIPSRIRTFMWLVKRGRIMCNTERRKQGFTLNESCSVCGAEKEDVEHVVRSCPAAMDVWLRLNFTNDPGNFFSMDFKL